MKPNVHKCGEGDKVALLIRGGMSDHRTWHAVEDTEWWHRMDPTP